MVQLTVVYRRISTHAPRTGSDAFPRPSPPLAEPFQPTLPARGATMAARSSALGTMDFNPRSPHGERQMGLVPEQEDTIFQPTLPARGATVTSSLNWQTSGHFNPRSPHGERPTSGGSR